MNPEARCKGRYAFFASPTPAAAASTAVTAAECALLLALADGGAASAVGGALHACWQSLHRLSVAVGGSASGRDVDSDGGGGDRADLRLAATAALLTSSGAALLAGMAATTADHARTAFTLAWNLRKEGKGLVVTSAKIGEWSRRYPSLPPFTTRPTRPVCARRIARGVFGHGVERCQPGQGHTGRRRHRGSCPGGGGSRDASGPAAVCGRWWASGGWWGRRRAGASPRRPAEAVGGLGCATVERCGARGHAAAAASPSRQRRHPTLRRPGFRRCCACRPANGGRPPVGARCAVAGSPSRSSQVSAAGSRSSPSN